MLRNQLETRSSLGDRYLQPGLNMKEGNRKLEIQSNYNTTHHIYKYKTGFIGKTKTIFKKKSLNYKHSDQ